MDRRAFITALGGGILFALTTVRAQQSQRTYRIGWLDSTGTRSEPYQIAFVERLRQLGFEEGRNLVIEFRTTKGR